MGECNSLSGMSCNSRLAGVPPAVRVAKVGEGYGRVPALLGRHLVNWSHEQKRFRK